MNLLSRLLSPFVSKHTEGEYRPGPYLVDGGWIPDGAGWNFWQRGIKPSGYGAQSAMVEACVSAYAQTAAMCPGDHWKARADGGRDRVSNSALSRIVRRPNDYQSMSDFMLNLTRQLYCDGEAFALALRNDRFEIAELHLMPTRSCAVQLSVDGDVFYHLGGNDIIERRFGGPVVVPMRDVLHPRLHTPRHPLKGESPILSAALDIAAQNTMLAQQIAFFTNRSRPSFILTTDAVLSADQATQLRDRWEDQSQGYAQGKTPILTGGLKPVQIATSAADAQLAETMKMTEQHIALAFRVPLQILGMGGQVQASTETLMQQWLASGLGFCLNHIEEEFGRLFNLYGMPNEYLEFDTAALLRSNLKDAMEAHARAVISGIESPDEARRVFSLGSVPGGHGSMPRVQQQVVPLDWHDKQPAPEPAAPPQLPAPVAEPDEEPDEDAERHTPDAIFRRLHDPATLLH